MKKRTSILFASLFLLSMSLSLTACGNANQDTSTEITVFAAASLQESLDQIISDYTSNSAHSNITITPNYDSSGTLKTQIENGAECDLFISAAPKQMDQLTELNLVDTETRIDLLENKVALAVPEGNPANIQTFDQLSELLTSGSVHLAIGNSDVPVGQYTEKIFEFYNLDPNSETLTSCLTYGSNVKEVTTQVTESTVDCGIIYATDAFSAGLTSVDQATAEMCGQVIYPAAVLKDSTKSEETKAFLDYLQSDAGSERFEAVGFTAL